MPKSEEEERRKKDASVGLSLAAKRGDSKRKKNNKIKI